MDNIFLFLIFKFKKDGDVDTSGSVTVHGDVSGDIDTSGSVSVSGNALWSIDAGGSVHLGREMTPT